MITAEAIKNKVSIAEVLSAHGISLKRGRCRCPIHNGDDLNFGVKDDFFHCFVCGASGDVIDLWQALENVDFREALAQMNEAFRLGYDAKTNPLDRARVARTNEKKDTFRQAKEATEGRNFAMLDDMISFRRWLWQNGYDCTEADKFIDSGKPLEMPWFASAIGRYDEYEVWRNNR